MSRVNAKQHVVFLGNGRPRSNWDRRCRNSSWVLAWFWFQLGVGLGEFGWVSLSLVMFGFVWFVSLFGYVSFVGLCLRVSSF